LNGRENWLAVVEGTVPLVTDGLPKPPKLLVPPKTDFSGNLSFGASPPLGVKTEASGLKGEPNGEEDVETPNGLLSGINMLWSSFVASSELVGASPSASIQPSRIDSDTVAPLITAVSVRRQRFFST
jgi:hypothetical protein